MLTRQLFTATAATAAAATSGSNRSSRSSRNSNKSSRSSSGGNSNTSSSNSSNTHTSTTEISLSPSTTKIDSKRLLIASTNTIAKTVMRPATLHSFIVLWLHLGQHKR
ncbi:hypothetical protein ACSSS7_007310 [Eimeria intestinalis]